MENSVRPQFSTHYKILGVYQILGSILGFLLLFHSLYQQGWSVVQLLALDIALFLFCLFSLICGLLCLKLNEIALSLSTINQVLQLFGFGVGGFIYIYTSGVNLSISLDFTHQLMVNPKIGVSKMLLQFNNTSGNSFIEINVIALAIIVWIDRVQQKIKNYKCNGVKTS